MWNDGARLCKPFVGLSALALASGLLKRRRHNLGPSPVRHQPAAYDDELKEARLGITARSPFRIQPPHLAEGVLNDWTSRIGTRAAFCTER